MLRIILTLFVLLFVFSFSVTLFGQKPAIKYFPHSLESLWVYEDQDGNELIRRAVEGEEINGKTYHAFNYEPELEDQTAYSPFIYPALYNVSDTGSITLLAGDEVEASIKTRLTKEMEFIISDPEFVHVKDVEIAIKVQGQDPLLFLPAELAVDTPWQANKIRANIKMTDQGDEDDISVSFNIIETGRVLGTTETIQTPAGTFDDCLKVEYKTQTKVSITPDSAAPPPDEIEPPGETITTLWFAPGIGIVKYHQKSDPIFLEVVSADEFEQDVAEVFPNIERTLELKEADIK